MVAKRKKLVVKKKAVVMRVRVYCFFLESDSETKTGSFRRGKIKRVG
jgi:hypothetical protein